MELALPAPVEKCPAPVTKGCRKTHQRDQHRRKSSALPLQHFLPPTPQNMDADRPGSLNLRPPRVIPRKGDFSCSEGKCADCRLPVMPVEIDAGRPPSRSGRRSSWPSPRDASTVSALGSRLRSQRVSRKARPVTVRRPAPFKQRHVLSLRRASSPICGRALLPDLRDLDQGRGRTRAHPTRRLPRRLGGVQRVVQRAPARLAGSDHRPAQKARGRASVVQP